jgi:hypothetical protein
VKGSFELLRVPDCVPSSPAERTGRTNRATRPNAPTFLFRVRRLRHGDERSLQGLKPIGFRSLTPGLKPRPPKEGGKDWGVFFLDSLYVGAPDRAGTGAAPTP